MQHRARAGSESEAQLAALGAARMGQGQRGWGTGSADGAGAALRSRPITSDPGLPPAGGSATAQPPPAPAHESPTAEQKLLQHKRIQKKKPISLPPNSRYCDKDVNLNHRLLSLFHLLLCHHVF